MSRISFTYSFGSMPLRNPGCLPIHSKRKSVFRANKGVSESKGINANSKIRFGVSKQAPRNYRRVQNCHNVSVKPYRTTKHAPSFFFFFQAHASSPRLMAVVAVVSVLTLMLILGVKQIQLTVHCTEGGTKNIISRHKRRCHGVHQCEPCLNIQFLPRTWGGSFDVYGRDFMSWAEYQRKGWL